MRSNSNITGIDESNKNIEEDIDALFDGVFLSLLSGEGMSKPFCIFFKCRESLFRLFYDFFSTRNATKKEIETISQRITPEKLGDFLKLFQKQAQEKSTPEGLEHIIFKRIIFYYTTLINRYRILTTLEEQDLENTVDGFQCNYIGDDFSIWYCAKTNNTFLKVGTIVYGEKDFLDTKSPQEQEDSGDFQPNVLIFGDMEQTFVFLTSSHELISLLGELDEVLKERSVPSIVTKYQEGGKSSLEILIFGEDSQYDMYTFTRKGWISFEGIHEVDGEHILLFNGVEIRDSFIKESKKSNKELALHKMGDIFEYVYSLSKREILGIYEGNVVKLTKLDGDIIVEVIENVQEYVDDQDIGVGGKVRKRSFYSVNEQECLFQVNAKEVIELHFSSIDFVICFKNKQGTWNIFSFTRGTSIINIREITKIDTINGVVDIEFIKVDGSNGVYNSEIYYNSQIDGKILNTHKLN